VGDPDSDNTQNLLQTYLALEEVYGELIKDLSAMPTSASISFPFMGTIISSARPCLGFYNSGNDFLKLKLMNDFPNGKSVNVLVSGLGGHGKTQKLTVDKFFQERLPNWLHLGMTYGVNHISTPVFKESFYDGWDGNTKRAIFQYTIEEGEEFPLNLEVLCRVAAGVKPNSFGLTIEGEYPNPERIFFPTPSSLLERFHKWEEYAFSKIEVFIDECSSIPFEDLAYKYKRFEQYFGVSSDFVESFKITPERRESFYKQCVSNGFVDQAGVLQDSKGLRNLFGEFFNIPRSLLQSFIGNIYNHDSSEDIIKVMRMQFNSALQSVLMMPNEITIPLVDLLLPLF